LDEHAEVLLHVSQLLVEASLLVLEEALAFVGVHTVAEEAERLSLRERVDRYGAD
jgi:hypothetical protein